MASPKRFQSRDNVVSTLFAIPAAGLLVWYFISSSAVVALLLNCYVLIATPMYVLTGSYPPFGTLWFWKAMLPVGVMVLVATYIQVQVTGWFHYIGVNLPTRMAFGFTACFATIEAVVSLRIVDATEPKITRG